MPLDASWSRRHTPRSRGSDGTSHRASGTPSAAAPRRRPSAILRDAGQLPVPSSLPRPGSPGPPATSPCRDSLVSIADDPFFQRYGSALSPDGPLATPAPQTRPDHNLLGNWPPPRRESLAAGSAQHWVSLFPPLPSLYQASPPAFVFAGPRSLPCWTWGRGACVALDPAPAGCFLLRLLAPPPTKNRPGTTRRDLARGPCLPWCKRRSETRLALVLATTTDASPASTLQSQTLPASPMESFNVAVIGAHGVDKSAFIQRALGLPRAPVAHTTSVRLVVDNVTHRLTLLELDLEHFQVSASRPIQWPKQIDGHMMPRVDAVLILYDVTSRASIRELPQTVGTIRTSVQLTIPVPSLRTTATVTDGFLAAALTGSALPVALVACESDSPRDEWEINPESMAQHELFKPCIAAYQVSPETPEVARTCLQAILKAAIAHRKGSSPRCGPPVHYLF